MLGSLSEKREMILGIAMGVLFSGFILPGFLGRLSVFTPWVLPNMLPVLGSDAAPLVPVGLPMLGTLLLSIAFLAIGLHKFNRCEF